MGTVLVMEFEDRPFDAVKGTGRGVSRANDVSPVKWTINELYGLGRDENQFIVYRAKRRTSDKPRAKRHAHKAVAYFISLEAAMVWIIMRQAHFPDEPTIDADMLDAFQSYCHRLDRVRADIQALAERLEMAGVA